MDFDELCRTVFDEIPLRLNSKLGLSICARERAKFEGWLKVELCDILGKKNYEATVPEKNRVDVAFEDWAIELKTVNTNYRFRNVENKHRPITKNVKGVIDDIIQLRSLEMPEIVNKAIVFIVFPVKSENADWQYHLRKITDSLEGSIRQEDFSFGNGVPGSIYVGLV